MPLAATIDSSTFVACVSGFFLSFACRFARPAKAPRAVSFLRLVSSLLSVCSFCRCGGGDGSFVFLGGWLVHGTNGISGSRELHIYLGTL